MRSTSTEAVQREGASRIEKRTGPPAHATDQRRRVLEILKDAGESGVYRELFLIPIDLGGYGVTQVSTRINELRKQGCIIDSKRVRPEHKFVTYYLCFVPERLKELHQDKKVSDDWYERATGKERPTGQSFGPLFDGVETRR